MTDTLDFDFDRIATQGAYFTTVTLCSLEEWLGEAVVPQCSQYHVVGCSSDLLHIMAKMNVWNIIQKYLALRRY